MDKQIIYLVSGPLGVGKTSLTRLINQRLGFALVDGDALFNPLENVKQLSWKERLEITWKNIVAVTQRYLGKELDVVIDFVVEDELEWFLKEISSFDVTVRYVVLVAQEAEIENRLIKREGSAKYLDRSLVLLKQFFDDPTKQEFLLDSTGKSTEAVLEQFITEDRFILR